jgi:hypothetical protein
VDGIALRRTAEGFALSSRWRRLRLKTIGKMPTLRPIKGIFIETSVFTARVGDYLTDEEYRHLQAEMLAHPECGDVMPRTGGFRKLRWADSRRGKGKRGGLRVVYYWLMGDGQFWMFSIYDKDEMENLTSDQEKQLKQAITNELKKRGTK